MAGTRVYVGNLDYRVQWQDLKDVMRQAGDVVRVEILSDNQSGKSKGCAICEFRSPDGARNAILNLNDRLVLGRRIFVREDREEGGPRSQPFSVIHRDIPNRDIPIREAPQGRLSSKTLVVQGVPPNTAAEDIAEHFSMAGGQVVGVQTPEEGVALVTFEMYEQAHEALRRLNGLLFRGRRLNISPEAGGTLKRQRAEDSFERQQIPKRKTGNMRNRIYISNLLFETTWQGVKDHFRNMGYNALYVDIFQDNLGRSRGCAVVEFETPQEAYDAILNTNDSLLDGRPILVREDREQ